MRKVVDVMKAVLKEFSGKLDGFYLAGGTALSLYYFNHRESYDLDFFTKDFKKELIRSLVSEVCDSLGLKNKLIMDLNQKGRARIIQYTLSIPGGTRDLRLDFVEDVFRLVRAPRLIDGVTILSKEDIYLRKIYAVAGTLGIIDEIGRSQTLGGRQEAKDLFDLYFLSKTFVPLSLFAAKYCDATEKENLVTWYRSFDRQEMKLGLNEINTDKEIDFREVDRHFRIEIEKLLLEQIP